MRAEISSGHNGVSVVGSCIPDWSLEGLTDTHFHARSVCLGIGLDPGIALGPGIGLCLGLGLGPGPGLCPCPCHASAAAHDGPLSNPGLHPNLGLHPNHDPLVHDGPGT